MRHPGRLDRLLASEEDIPLEMVMLLIGGMALAITGGLLFPVAAGTLPYYEDGFFGLLLIVFALQTITLGKTPFGELRRSVPVLGFGVVIAAIGMVTCFIPGLFDPLPRLLLAACFGLGGALQLVRANLDPALMRTWQRQGGILHTLTVACWLVYGLSLLAGILLWAQPPLQTPVTAALMLLFGAAVIYLGGVLRLVYRAYLEAEPSRRDQLGFTLDHSMLLVVGVFMILLGGLLIPVSLGWLPFSRSAQLGLLMIIFAIQMLAAGNTPIGLVLPRSWVVVGCGVLFAALGIISCVIPELLAAPLIYLVAVLNILGGLIPLGKRLYLAARPADGGGVPAHPLLTQLARTQLALALLSVMFGSSMLVPGIIPGVVVGAILAMNGGAILYLLRILLAISALARQLQAAQSNPHIQ